MEYEDLSPYSLKHAIISNPSPIFITYLSHFHWYIILLSACTSSKSLFSWGLPNKICYGFLIYLMRATWCSCITYLHLITVERIKR